MPLKFREEIEFKETEIGEIPKDWEVKEIKEICIITTGGTPSRQNEKYWKDGTINWLKSKEVSDNYIYNTEEKITEEGRKRSNAKKIYAPGTIILAIYAAPTAGKVAILKTYSTINQALAALECRDGISDNKFIFFSLIANRERLLSYASGSAQQNLNLELAKNFPLQYPKYQEQTRISQVLSWFDDLIENKKKQNEILEKTAMALFKSWFVDFEPFRNEKFVDSELGKIPKGWEVKVVALISEIIMGQSPPSKFYNEDGIGLPFIQGKGQFGNYTPNTTTYCSKSVKLAKPYDILITIRAPVGELNLSDKEYVIGRGLASLRSRYWVFLYLNLASNKDFLKSLGRGTTYDAIIKEDLESFPLILPPQPILQKFHSIVEPLFQKIILNQKEIMVLRKVRDTLLPLLVFGKLRVEEL